MLNIYEVVDKKLTSANSIKKGSWIDLVNPTSEELNFVIENTKIAKETLYKNILKCNNHE